MFGSMIKLTISDQSSRIPESHHDPGILFLLRGSAEIASGVRRAGLQAEDYLVINSYEIYTQELSGNSLMGRISMNYAAVNDYLQLSQNDIRCSSLPGTLPPDIRDRLRRQIKRLFSYYEGQEGDEASRMMSVFFDLLYDLRKNCLVKKSERIVAKKTDNLAVEESIRRYLEEHYLEKVMLRDLARETYFSEAYLSRYIKQHFGKNYVKLLSDIRVSHARQRLRETDDTVLRVAMDSGFSDVAAMNRAFWSEYGISPAEYRRQEQERMLREADSREESESELDEMIREFFREEGADFRTEDPQVQRLFANEEQFRRLRPFWSRLVNGGRAQDLLRADLQVQILHLQAEIGFRYIRFWDIWSPDMRIYGGDDKNHYNFTMLDAIIAFLYDHHLIPYIELGLKPVQLNSSYTNALIYEERDSPFDTLEEYSRCIQEMLRHYVWLYGAEYVEQWYLELWNDLRLDSCEQYLDIFENVYRSVKTILPAIHIGGGGTNREKESGFEALIQCWKNRVYRPDFVSVYLYTVDNGFLSEDTFSEGKPRMWENADYTERFLGKIRRILREQDFRRPELHISEWNFSPANRDPINDSTFKAAYVVKSLLEMRDQVDMLGYWPGSDLVTGFYDTGHLIDGSAGLLTRNNICKPVFYGLQFFSQLDDYVIGQDANSIVTSNRRGSYRIVCHNYQQPGNGYYVQHWETEDNTVGADEFFSFEEREFRIVIRNVENGTYYIKKRLLDREHGCVQREWKQMGYSDVLNAKDMEYLRGICVPQILVEHVEVTKRELTIDYALETNAVMSIHIFRAEGGSFGNMPKIG